MSYLGQQLGQGQAERFVYTATGGETSVTTDDAGRGIAYTVGQVDVYLNGAKLINGSDFTATTGTSITGLAALTAADVLEVFALSIFQASDTVSASVGGTFNGNVTVDADLSVTGTTTITTADINGGAIDGTTIGGSSAGAGTFSGLTVENTDATITLSGTRGTGDTHTIATAGVNSQNLNISADDSIYLRTSDTVNRIGIFAGGDISFYEDTGTTPKLFWDASAESLGIGTSSPAGRLHINDSAIFRSATDYIANTYEAVFTETNTGGSGTYPFNANGHLVIQPRTSAGRDIVFATGSTTPSTRMVIDASGNLLVGKTSQNIASAGLEVLPVGTVQITRNNTSLVLNRLTTDGTLAEFRKDGVTVGSIGESAGLYIERASGAGWQFGVGNISPRKSGALADGQVDLGSTSYRYKDLYLSGGVYLGGTGAANHLDDYEEGTWTGSINTTSGTTGTFSSVDGVYVKIGKLVTVTGTLSGTSMVFTSSSSFVRINGFPFTANSATEGFIGNFAGGTVNSGINGALLIGTGTGTSPYIYAVHSATASNNSYFTVTYETL